MLLKFRIVRDRWYHRILDYFIGRIFKVSEDTIPAYQIHLESLLVKKYGIWVLYNRKHLKTYELIPKEDFHKQWAQEIDSTKCLSKITPSGYEINMSDIQGPEPDQVEKEIEDKSIDQWNALLDRYTTDPEFKKWMDNWSNVYSGLVKKDIKERETIIEEKDENEVKNE